jgi:hypothetical protein
MDPTRCSETSANEYNTLDNIPKSIQRRKLDISVNISFAVATRKFDTAHADSNYRSGSFSDKVYGFQCPCGHVTYRTGRQTLLSHIYMHPPTHTHIHTSTIKHTLYVQAKCYKYCTLFNTTYCGNCIQVCITAFTVARSRRTVLRTTAAAESRIASNYILPFNIYAKMLMNIPVP